MHPDEQSLVMTGEEQRRGRRNIVLTSLFSIIYVYTVTGTVINLFALRIGMTPDRLGLVNALPSFFVLAQVLVVNHVARLGKRFFTIIFYGLQALLASLYILVPSVYRSHGGELAATALLLLVAASSITEHLAQAAWVPQVRDCVPDEILGRYLGRMRTAWQVVGIAYLGFISLYIGREPSLERFQTVFLIGAVAVLIRHIFIIRIPENRHSEMANGLPRGILEPLWDTNYRRYLVFLSLLFFGLGFAAPFIVAFMKQWLRLPSGIITMIASLEAVGAVLTLMAWGRIVDRYGERGVFGLGTVAVAAAAMTWVFLDRPGLLLLTAASLAALVRGAAAAGISLVQTGYGMKAAPRVNGTSYMVMSSISAGLALGLGPLVGGQMLMRLQGVFGEASAVPFRLLFLCNTAILLAAMLLKQRVDWRSDLGAWPMFIRFLWLLRQHRLPRTGEAGEREPGIER